MPMPVVVSLPKDSQFVLFRAKASEERKVAVQTSKQQQHAQEGEFKQKGIPV